MQGCWLQAHTPSLGISAVESQHHPPTVRTPLHKRCKASLVTSLLRNVRTYCCFVVRRSFVRRSFVPVLCQR